MMTEIEITRRFEARIAGKRGAPEKRARFRERVARLAEIRRAGGFPNREISPPPDYYRHERCRAWKSDRASRKALGIARMAGMFYSEYASGRGDHLATVALDYVDRRTASATPYFDHGGAGMALVAVRRTRVYPKSSKWRPSIAATVYLCGRNESGTWYAHAVSGDCRTVLDAVQWIWGGQARDIIERQGDIALIHGLGPKLPRLPDGHAVAGDRIEHAQHAPLRLPAAGERIIVGRRASVRVSEETRD